MNVRYPLLSCSIARMTLCRSTARLNGLANQCAAAKDGYGGVAMVVLGNRQRLSCVAIVMT
jgi:hypothetical protein